ncbi:hypothetical protein VA596_23455 [Amycolatopsis sp., V23-08]|uniref:Uncharacterized protein n=1 Tax=Amycolatopsis heterodermiae TaxID=3110235 RepID=A0ABU5R8E5_9PSEU|nr:hypothetical protein [Amycolatopsis sp., V23-08]MEA5362513.1 hypothetical protein [Amycolatopsis sp., V23-08]
MVLSGEQWLAQVFRPAVAGMSRARRSAGPVSVDPLRLLGSRLAAQVEALGDTGVLTDEQEIAALDALEEAGIRSSSASSVSSSASVGAAPVAVRTGSAPVVPREPLGPPVLRGVLAGPRHLGQLHGRPVTLISAELWTDRFLVDLCTDPGPEHRDRRARTAREQLEWMKRLRRGQATERPNRAITGSALGDLTWEPRDEQGTGYRRIGGSGESGDHLDRQRMQWSPAPPADSGRLTLLARDTTGAIVLDAEIPLPRPTT